MAMKHSSRAGRLRGACSAKDVAEAYGIPQEALAKILQRLAKAGAAAVATRNQRRPTRWPATRTRFSAFEVIQAIDGTAVHLRHAWTVRGEVRSDRSLHYSRTTGARLNESIEQGAEENQDIAHARRAGKPSRSRSQRTLVTIV